MHEIGVLYLEQGQYNEAEAKLNEAYKGRIIKLGPQHPHSIESLKQLIELYEALGKPDEVKKWRVSLQQIRETE